MTYWLLPLLPWSIALGHAFVLLGVSLGFARGVHYRRGVIAATWRPQFHWASWLALGLLIATGAALLAVFKLWGFFALTLALGIVITGYLLGQVQRMRNGKKPYSITIGHGMILIENPSDGLVFHELLHVLQYEDLIVLAAMAATALYLLTPIGWQNAIVVWALGGAPCIIPNFLTALIRYGRPGHWMDVYRRSLHEDHAYARQEVEYG